jgi:hypothetical protein
VPFRPNSVSKRTGVALPPPLPFLLLPSSNHLPLPSLLQPPAPAPLPPTTGTYTPAHHDASGSNGETSASHVAALSSPTRVPSSQGPTHPHHHQQHFAFPPAGDGDFENDPDL